MWQSRRAQWAVKPLAAIEDCASRPSSESADDSVHVAIVRKINLTPPPRQACRSRELQSCLRPRFRGQRVRYPHLISSLITVVKECLSTPWPIERKRRGKVRVQLMRDLSSAHKPRETWSGLWFSVAQSFDENPDGHHGLLTWTGVLSWRGSGAIGMRQTSAAK